MSGSFNMTTWTEVALDTYLYESSAAAVVADYVLSVNMTSAALFTTAIYQQNEDDATKYDVALALNVNNLKDKLLTTGDVSISAENANGVDNFTTSTNAGRALLEVMARKIFRHPKAAAAIANDDKFLGGGNNDLSAMIAVNLGATFNTSLIAQGSADAAPNTVQADLQNLFESYVALGRVNSADDISGYQPMVFQNGDKFTFPFYLKGELYDDDSVSIDLIHYYVDTTISAAIHVGKDGGRGFISPGSVNSNVTGAPLAVGQYEVPIRLEITIASS